MCAERANSRRIECYGATRPQAGRLANEDAVVIEREPIFHAAVFDGAGNAEQAAHRVARFFKTIIRDQLAKVGDPAAWAGWIKLMDSFLLGGNQSTFVGLAVPGSGIWPDHRRLCRQFAALPDRRGRGQDQVTFEPSTQSPRHRSGRGQDVFSDAWALRHPASYERRGLVAVREHLSTEEGRHVGRDETLL